MFFIALGSSLPAVKSGVIAWIREGNAAKPGACERKLTTVEWKEDEGGVA